MIRFFVPLLVIVLTGVSLHAQQRAQIVGVVQGEDLVERTTTSLQFVFPNFMDGKVAYKNGRTISGMLNYNILIGEMQFVDIESQSVFALADLNNVAMIEIAGRIFVPSSGKEFYEILYNGRTQLAVRFRGNRLSHGRETPYGNTGPSARSSDMTAVNVDGYFSTLDAKENIRVTVNTDYYLIDGKKRRLITNSKAFLKTFSKDKAGAIEQFIRQNSINFNNRSDLILLVDYCNQL